MKNIIVNENESGQRLDKLLAKYLNKAPKSFIYKMLRKKNITLNGKKAEGNEKLNLNDEIKLFLADETIDKFSEIKTYNVKNNKLDIIYEDENIAIINKPAGVLSQKASDEDISLNEMLISYLLDKGEITKETLRSFKPAICNRLDRNTSGIVIAGKSLRGLQTMSELLKNRELNKYYICIVNGQILKEQLIEGWLLKDETTNKVSISKNKINGASYIKTAYKPLSNGEDYTILEVKLFTGRSHQIRAHLASIGHSIIGDYKYGIKSVNDKYKKMYNVKYQLLHSFRLELPIMEEPFKDISNMVIEAELPDIFKKISSV